MNRLVVFAVILIGLAVLTFPALAAPPRVFVWEETIGSGGPGALRQPVAVAASPAGEIGVLDAHENRFLVFSFQAGAWTLVRSVDLPGVPRSIAHDGNAFLISLRGSGGLLSAEGPAYGLRPTSLPAGTLADLVAAVPGGGFLVFDAAGLRVYRLDALRRVVGDVSVGTGITALAATSGGGFVTAVAENAEVRLYDAQGSFNESWTVPGSDPVPAWPVGIVTDPGGGAVVLDRHGARLVALNAAGRLEGVGSRPGWVSGLLRFPAGMAAMADGRIVVADLGNGRVQIFARAEEEDGS